MYTLKISDDDSVIGTVRETIMQRSNIVNNVQILVPRYYKGQIDMSDFTLYMKYTLPVSHKIKLKQLKAVDLNYEQTNYIQYVIPAEIPITAEAGDIELSFTFLKLDETTQKSYIRKTQSGYITITPIAMFDQYEPDEMFSELDQRLLMLEALQKQLEALNKVVYDMMPTDVKLDKNDRKVTLVDRDGENTGNGFTVGELSTMIGEDIVGTDPDNEIDGVTDLDKILKGTQIVTLDKLIK